MSNRNSNGANGSGSSRTRTTTPVEFHFSTVPIESVLRTRRGKHHDVIAQILADLGRLSEGNAIQVPLSTLKSTKLENLRAALNRATRSRNMMVSTSADEEYLYVWMNAR